jgi:hypothetical protein
MWLRYIKINWIRKINVEVHKYKLPLFHVKRLKDLCKRRENYFSVLKYHMKEVCEEMCVH